MSADLLQFPGAPHAETQLQAIISSIVSADSRATAARETAAAAEADARRLADANLALTRELATTADRHADLEAARALLERQTTELIVRSHAVDEDAVTLHRKQQKLAVDLEKISSELTAAIDQRTGILARVRASETALALASDSLRSVEAAREDESNGRDNALRVAGQIGELLRHTRAAIEARGAALAAEKAKLAAAEERERLTHIARAAAEQRLGETTEGTEDAISQLRSAAGDANRDADATAATLRVRLDELEALATTHAAAEAAHLAACEGLRERQAVVRSLRDQLAVAGARALATLSARHEAQGVVGAKTAVLQRQLATMRREHGRQTAMLESLVERETNAADGMRAALAASSHGGGYSALSSSYPHPSATMASPGASGAWPPTLGGMTSPPRTYAGSDPSFLPNTPPPVTSSRMPSSTPWSAGRSLLHPAAAAAMGL